MLSTKNAEEQKPKTAARDKAALSLSSPTDTQGGTLYRTNPSTGRVFTTPAGHPTNGVRIGKSSDHRIDVSEPRTAHKTELAVVVDEFLIIFHVEVLQSESCDYWAFHGTTLLEW